MDKNQYSKKIFRILMVLSMVIIVCSVFLYIHLFKVNESSYLLARHGVMFIMILLLIHFSLMIILSGQMQDIQFDEIKIDKQFFSKGLNHNGRIVLQEIFHMLKRMHKSIVCEGVETEDAIAFLTELDCDELQGFYYYKPMPLQAFELLLSQDRSPIV
ncbi:MAG: EAL domain-containing protein [Lachnospiraceae bacterium]|nr:EAL domain-containing protein [Lachnospiraceae bacterium]